MNTVPLGPGEIADLAFLVFIGIFAIVAIASLFTYLIDRGRVRLAAKLLAEDKPVPPSLFDRRPQSELVRGIVLVALGVGVALYFALGGELALARAGLVPGAIGAGYLIGYRLEQRRAA